MLSFLIRRILFGVLTLLVVTAVTFAIFFLLPRLAGQTADVTRAQQAMADVLAAVEGRDQSGAAHVRA